MPGRVCVDSGVALMLVIHDPLRDKARALWQEWLVGQVTLVAPWLFRAEVTSILNEQVYKGEMTTNEAHEALDITLQWPVVLWDGGAELQRQALDFAIRFERPKAYDSQYLAVASFLGCDLWTNDTRLLNAIAGRLPWVHWVGDYQP